jgi:hypothetical protein
MNKTFRMLASTGALLCFAAAPAAAQVLNHDQIQTLTSTAAITGLNAPGAAGSGGGAAPVTSRTVGSQARLLAGGSSAEQAVGSVLSGGPTATLRGVLTGAGAPAAQVLALTSALSLLATSPSPAALAQAIQTYNALVRAAPAGFIANPPAQLAAVRAALIGIRAGL